MGRNTVQPRSLRAKASFVEGAEASPPSENAERFHKLITEIRWFLSLAACTGLLLVLVTYHPTDPAWSNNSSGIIKNLGGRAGAYLSDLMLFIFGVSAYWWVILFARRVFAGWQKMTHVQLSQESEPKVHLRDSWLVRWLGFLMTLSASVGLESIRLHSLKIPMPNVPGGVLGEAIGDPLQNLLGFTGSTLFLLLIFFAGLSLFLHFSWIGLSEKVGRNLELGFQLLRNKQSSAEDRKIGEVAAVEREELVEEELEKFEVEEPIQIVRQEPVILKSERVEREKQQILFEEIPDSELPPLSLLDAAASNKDKGGNSESGISSNKICCFSRSTRSLLRITGSCRTICIGSSTSNFSNSSSTNSSRSTAATSPIFRSSAEDCLFLNSWKPSSRFLPTFSDKPIHEKCRNKDNPAKKISSKNNVEPVNPSRFCKGSPIASPSTPPGTFGIGIFNECKRIDSSPTLALNVIKKPNQRTNQESRKWTFGSDS